MASYSSRQQRRKQSNRNFFIITIGFLFSLMFVIYATQNLMQRLEQQKGKKSHLLHIEIENTSNNTAIPCKMNIDDVVLFSDTIREGKMDIEKDWNFDTAKTINATFGNKVLDIEDITLADSISYLMIQITENDDDFKVRTSFFR